MAFDLDQVRGLIELNGYTVDTVSSVKLGKILGTNRHKARRLLDKFKQDKKYHKSPGSDSPVKVANESIEETQTNLTFGIRETRIHTLDQLIEHFNVDLTTWEVERFVCNKWEVGAKDNDGAIQVEPLYQVKAWFKKAKGWTSERIKAEIDRIKQESKKDFKPFYVNKLKKPSENKTALEISIADLHAGKLCWAGETGYANYDTKIALDLYRKAFCDILYRSTQDIDKIMLVVGNDLMNSDSRAGLTTNGTPQANDSRYHRMFQETFQAVNWSIKEAAQVAPVEVKMVPGNHDNLSVWHLGHSLECMFADSNRVSVDNSPLLRKYWHYGNVLVMLTHGDTPKSQNLFSLMPLEAPVEFVNSRYREIHLGHLHQKREQNIEKAGVYMRIISSLTPPDFWHYQNGYVGNVRAAQGFEWNYLSGLVGTREYSVDVHQEA